MASEVPARAACSSNSWRMAWRAASARPWRSVALVDATAKGRSDGDLCGHLERDGNLVAGRDRPLGDADPPRFGRDDPSSGEEELGGTSGPDDARQRGAQGEARMDTEANEVGLEPAELPDDTEVAGQSQPEPGPDGRPLDGGHQGNGRVEDPHRLLVERAGPLLEVALVGGVRGIAGAEVRPGTERSALRAHHRRSDHSRQPGDGVGQGTQDGLGEQVVRRSTQGDDGHVPVLVHRDVVAGVGTVSVRVGPRRGLVPRSTRHQTLSGTTLGRAGEPGGL